MASKKIVLSCLFDVLGVGIITGAIVCGSIFDPILTLHLGTIGGNSASQKEYTKYKTAEELDQARKDISVEIEGEGAVLLKNSNNALPLSKNSKVSVFGQHAHEILASGSGSGSIGNPEKNLKEVLEESSFEVNQTLWDFYLDNGVKSLGNAPALAGGNTKTDWSINECPQEKYTAAVKDSLNAYNDAAIVVISRTGGEGGDLPMQMDLYGGKKEEHYLELNQDEKDLLSMVTSSFKKTIVLLNTNNDFEMGFLKDYDIDSCLLIGGVGLGGLSGIGKILNGEINPSGHLNDTLVYDDFSAPSSQNFGDFIYSNSTDYNYVVYSEGIYVGYRYYETRYADKVQNAENVGTFDYDSTVAYPFGYGMSYTDFEWSDASITFDAESDSFIASVKVTNTGKVAGKDAVGLYFSSPYIHGTTKIQKSEIELGGFAKTGIIEPGSSETIKITMPKSEMASYDYQDVKSYVLEAGDYYLTLAKDSHDAVNSVLKEKGCTVDSKNISVKYTQASTDSDSYSHDAETGTKITNLFDDAKYDGMTVLSRDDWTKTNSLKVSNLSLSEKDLQQAKKIGAEASLNPEYSKDPGTPTTKSGNTLQLKYLVETEFDDEKWMTLVEEISKADLQKLFSTAGYSTITIENIGKPVGKDTDGPAGLQSFVGGASSLKAY